MVIGLTVTVSSQTKLLSQSVGVVPSTHAVYSAKWGYLGTIVADVLVVPSNAEENVPSVS